jgi:archaellum component FlaC
MAPRGPKGLLPLIVTMIVSSLIFAACNKNEGSLPKTDKQATLPSSGAGNGATSQSTGVTQTERDSYMQAAREDMDKLRGKLDELKTKAQNSSADVKARLEKEIPPLEDQLKTVEKRFDELKNASAASWQELKTAFAASIENLKSAVNKSSAA